MSSRTSKRSGRRSLFRGLAAAFTLAAALALMAGTVLGAGPPTDEHGGESDMAGVWTPPTAIYAVRVSAPGTVERWTQGPGWVTWYDATPSSGLTGDDVGSAIVFSSTRPAPSDGSTDAEIYLRHADGGIEQLTDNTALVSDETGEEEPIDDLNPVLSPDGTRVAFDSAPAPVPSDEEEGEDGGGPPEGLGGGPPDNTGSGPPADLGGGKPDNAGTGEEGSGDESAVAPAAAPTETQTTADGGEGSGAGAGGQGPGSGQGSGSGAGGPGGDTGGTGDTGDTGSGSGSGSGSGESSSDSGGRPPLSGQAAAQIWILDLSKAVGEDGRLTQVTFSPASEGPSAQPTWSPDGSQIAFTRGSGTGSHVMVLDLTSGEETTVSTGSQISNPAWSPTDPDLLAVTVGAGVMADLYTIDLSDGSMHQLLATGSLAEARPAFSPDGGSIAYQAGDDAIGAGISVIPTAGGTPQAITAPTLWSDRNPGWSDDDTIVFESTKDARPAADLGVSIGGDPGSVTTGGTVTYTIEVKNAGPLTAPGVKVVTTLPSILDVDRTIAQWAVAEHGNGGDEGEGEGEDETTPPAPPTVTGDGNVITVDFGDFAKGDRGAVGATIEIAAHGVSTGTATVRTEVSLTPGAEQPAFYDPVAENDVATVDTTVGSAPSSDTSSAGSAPSSSSSSGGGGAAPATPAAPAPRAAATAPVVVNGLTCTVAGTEGDDVLIGTNGRDVICGLGGDDWIVGLGGNDVVFAGPGDDWVDGGPGNDWLDAGAGDDFVNGGTGKDREYGRAGDDTITHMSGFSRAYGGPGNDLFVTVDSARDWVNGSTGTDTAHTDKSDRTYAVEHRS